MDGHVTQVTHFDDQIVGAVVGPDNRLYLTSRKGAPHGKLLVLPLTNLDLAHARTLVPEGDDVIRTGGEFSGEPVTITKNAIYLRELAGGPTRLAAFSLDGGKLPDVPLPPVAAVPEIAAMPDGSLLYEIATYLRPVYVQRFNPATGKLSETKLAEPAHLSTTRR